MVRICVLTGHSFRLLYTYRYMGPIYFLWLFIRSFIRCSMLLCWWCIQAKEMVYDMWEKKWHVCCVCVWWPHLFTPEWVHPHISFVSCVCVPVLLLMPLLLPHTMALLLLLICVPIVWFIFICFLSFVFRFFALYPYAFVPFLPFACLHSTVIANWLLPCTVYQP